MRYQLAPGLSFCTTEGQRVFLDVGRDRYFCLGPEADTSFGRLADGITLEQSDLARLEALADQGVLRVVSSGEQPAPCAAGPAPLRSLFAAGATRPAAIFAALVAYQASRWQLRRRGLGPSLLDFARRKQRIAPSADADRIAAETARAFKAAAGLATTWDFCLAHSLAVARTLVRRNVPVDLILGVHMGPFMAHAWVQFGDAVVNDRVDTVRDFTPILVL